MEIDAFIHCTNSISQMPFEIVEIKGRGHPDTICDLLCEYVSKNLLNYYQTTCGYPLHYNVDKAFLVAGKAAPRFGGGAIVSPAKLYLGDRASEIFQGKKLLINDVVRESVDFWLKTKVRFLRLGSNLEFYNEIKSGSESLSAVEERGVSNDTSVGVGSWPPTPLEHAVIQLERHLNSNEFKVQYPETGEDIKIMAVRNGNNVDVTCAIAMVDRYICSVDDYISKKEQVIKIIFDFLHELKIGLDFDVQVNCLDDPKCGESGLHLTVTGLSCENGDSGQVGRGNRVNNLISFLRPQTMEAWAGKNPISHVGKIYSFAAQNLAKAVCDSISEAAQANVYMVGKIGNSVKKPQYVYCDVAIPKSCTGHSFREEVKRILEMEIERGEIFQIQNMTRAT